MANSLKKTGKSLLLTCSPGMLLLGMIYFSTPYPVFADVPLDQDNDGIADADDNCPLTANPNQYDLDGDGIGIVCDNLDDQDNDGISDADDNCPDMANPNQYDLDGDGIGIVCDNLDPDQDNDGIADADDNCPDMANPNQYDLDHDGIGVVCDDDRIDNREAVNRALYLENQGMKARGRAIGFEANTMMARARYIAFEANATAALERARAEAIRVRKQEISERNLPGPIAGCEGCHANVLPGVRQIAGINGDFTMSSHHVQGTVQSIDCLACHYTGDHQSGIVKLVDPDQGTNIIYDYKPAAPGEIEPFCLNCHDSDGAVAGLWTKPFSDEMEVPNVKGVAGSMWTDSAHASIPYAINGGQPITCLGDGMVNGCHANGHGSDNYKIMAADAPRLDVFCSNCHIGYDTYYNNGSHPMGQQITANGNTYTQMCTTCHNPHLVRNQVYLETEPDFTSDPIANPYAMGTTLISGWGCMACHDY